MLLKHHNTIVYNQDGISRAFISNRIWFTVEQMFSQFYVNCEKTKEFDLILDYLWLDNNNKTFIWVNNEE